MKQTKRAAPQGDKGKPQHISQGQDGNDDHLHDYTDWILEGWKQERPDLDVSPVAIINRLGRLSSYFRIELAAVYERFGLSGPSFAVIATLRRAGTPYQLSQRALMDMLQLTSGTISVRIDRLVQDGLAERSHRSYQEECLAHERPATLEQARQVTADFVQHYNVQRPNQARSCGNQPPRSAFPTLPALRPLPQIVDPDSWLESLHGWHVERKVNPHGMVKLDLKSYYSPAS